ncbi:annulin-like [Artemia franciscana]|uniref:annulin-like n=1 Tax=Artemia franciscana TaxID=6661 RepID=UPI0032DBA698
MGNCFSFFFKNLDKRDSNELDNVDKPHKPEVLRRSIEEIPGNKPRPLFERTDIPVRFELPRPPTSSSNTLLLKVTSVNLNISENGKSHETWNYDWMEKGKDSRLIIRRGQSFTLTVSISRPFDSKKDIISLIFTCADAVNPSPSRRTQVLVSVYPEGDFTEANDWVASVVKSKNTTIEIKIATPADCIVGAWHLDIDTQRKDGNDSICYTLPTPLYILFNPWCKVDQVYMEDEDCRKEYILSDSGLIWQGTSSSLKQMAWNFSQFEELVLDCALYVINKVGRVPVHQRRDPVKIVRAISAAVNAQDDNGILVGNWTGDFVGGTPPTGWNGSMRILQKYFRTKEPVKFGQCWVFAGVTTTICRALGIPSRVITNFDSAHDTTASITVDVFVDGEGNPIKELCKDSVWNFHVWNEVWMERPDIGNGYGGWQVIDATPQERSADNSMFCCGPASVTAIRRGEVLKPYDGEFVFAMANADQVFWRYNENDTKMKLLGQDIDKIGQNISTKEVGRFERLDITQEYKPDDGSVEERKAVARALRTATNDKSRYYYNKAFYDVNFEISRIDNVVIGKPLRVLFTVVNKHETNSSDIVATLSLYSVLYTGIPSRLVKKETFSHTINPFSKMELGFDVTYEEYADALTDQGLFKISLMGKVPNIDYEMFSQSDVRVRKPDVNFNGRALCQVNSHLVLEVSLENPLPVPLTKPRFSVEGPGMGPAQKIKLDDVIPVNGIAKGVVTLIPRTTGEKAIAGSFWCNELEDVKGMFHIKVL